MATAQQLTEKLRALEVEANAAAARAQEAQRVLSRTRRGRGEEVLAGVVGLKNERSYDPEVRNAPRDYGEDRKRTREACEAIIERGLVFEPIGETSDIIVVDVALDEAFEATTEERKRTANAVTKFENVQSKGLLEERKEATARRLRSAVDSGDTETVRELLG